MPRAHALAAHPTRRADRVRKRMRGRSRAGLRAAALAALAVAILAAAAGRLRAEEAQLRVALPAALIEMGLAQHLLPRFRFKTRIRAEAVAGRDGADLAIAPEAELAGLPARRLMTGGDGTIYALALLAEDGDRRARAARFDEWLRSGPGRRALEGFELDGAQAFEAGAAAPEKKVEVVVEGDAVAGSRLALVHCGRCHVIDERNRYGGIGSTPSFAALRSMQDWRARFAGFYAINPHPAFTQVEGVTEPFDPMRPPPIAPLSLTLDDAQAIAAFAATIPPKDLGAAVLAR